MANKQLFGRAARVHASVPAADIQNDAGGQVYLRTPKAALAQYAATGTFGATFYAQPEVQLAELKAVLDQLQDDPEFIAKCAIYSRRAGCLKDMPALLYVFLAQHGHKQWADLVFDQVCNNAKMVRNVIQICEAGAFGRTTIPRSTRRKVSAWLNTCSMHQFLNGMVGNDPTLAQVIKKVHARPQDEMRRAMFAYARGEISATKPVGPVPVQREHLPAAQYKYLPKLFHSRDHWLTGRQVDLDLFRGIDQRLFAGRPLNAKEWAKMARNTRWHATVKNLAAYARQGAFEADPELASILAKRIVDEVTNPHVMAMPYEVLAAYVAVANNDGVPFELRSDALQDAIDAAANNAPTFSGSVAVFVDVSGSMNAPVTGYRKKPSAVRCSQVAALMAACIAKQNPGAGVFGFHTEVLPVRLNHRDSVMTNAEKLYELPSGGTDCSATVAYLSKNSIDADTVILFSDNESWYINQSRRSMWYGSRGTTLMHEWQEYCSRGRKDSKLILCDLAPSDDSQVVDRPDILNVGGFSDAVFQLMHLFAEGKMDADHWISEISRVSFD